MQKEHKPRKSTKDDRVELRFLESLRKRRPDDSEILKVLGDLYTRVGEFDKGLQVDLHLRQICPREPLVWYNLGCSYALVHQDHEALDALNHAIELGYADRDWLLQDEDLATLQDHPAFKDLLNRFD